MSNSFRARYALPPVRAGLIILEVLIITLAALFAVRVYLNFAPDLRPRGMDWIFLTATGGYAREIFARSVAIPLWNPFVGAGEPMIESVLSFILNPFMFLPILISGVVTGGKIAIILHAIIMGVGGWVLARTLRMDGAGRVLCGVLLAASGGFAASVGEGHYQIGLSLAYVPWILAGLIGTLYLSARWPIGLLAISVMLMNFAGSNWYVLPTAMTCGLFALFSLLDWRPGARFPLRLSRHALCRLMIGAVLIGLLCMVRWIGQYTAGRYLAHPRDTLNEVYSLAEAIQVYFEPTAGSAGNSFWLRYNYIFPGRFALIILAGWLLIWPDEKVRPRAAVILIVIPALLAIALFTAWAMGATDLIRQLYTDPNFVLLSNWRRMGRMGAAAAPLLIVLIAWMFDRLYARVRSERIRLLGVRLPPYIAQILSVGVALVGLIAVPSVLNNWFRVGGVVPVDPGLGALNGVTYIRSVYPDDMLSINTWDIAPTVEFYSVLARQSVGNPEIYTFGRRATLGNLDLTASLSQFAAGYNTPFLIGLPARGFQPVPDAPLIRDSQAAIAQFNPTAFPYVFSIPRSRLDQPTIPLNSEATAQSYAHRIDRILITLPPRSAPQVVVAQETAYPGWKVTVNGVSARVESIAGRIGVVVPEGAETANIEFFYRPDNLFQGALVSLVGALLFVAYLLRIDQRLIGMIRRGTEQRRLYLSVHDS